MAENHNRLLIDTCNILDQLDDEAKIVNKYVMTVDLNTLGANQKTVAAVERFKKLRKTYASYVDKYTAWSALTDLTEAEIDYNGPTLSQEAFDAKCEEIGVIICTAIEKFKAFARLNPDVEINLPEVQQEAPAVLAGPFMGAKSYTPYTVTSVTGVTGANSCMVSAIEEMNETDSYMTDIKADDTSTMMPPGMPPTHTQQGDASTCTAHALGKTICAAGEKHTPRINFIQGETINQAILLGKETIVQSGAWPYNWNGKSFILKENGVSEGNLTDKTYQVTLDIKKLYNMAQYGSNNKEYILVVKTDMVPQLQTPEKGLHCLYIEDRDGEFWHCLNSWGRQDGTVKVPMTTPGNTVYEVDVSFREMNAGNSATQTARTPGLSKLAITPGPGKMAITPGPSKMAISPGLSKLDLKKLILKKISEQDDFKEQLQDYANLPSTNINSSWTEDGTKLTLLHYAVKEKNEEAVKTLLEHGANPNTAAHEGGSPLHLAAKLGSFDITALLLNSGAKVDQQNNSKNTPLHVASRFGNIEVGQLLLENDANVNSQMNSGWTPLHAAVTLNHENMVRLLCSFKADLTLKASSRKIDPSGKKMTPMELAEKQGLDDIVAILENQLKFSQLS